MRNAIQYIFLFGCLWVCPAAYAEPIEEYRRPIRWEFADNNPVIAPGQLHGDFDRKRVSCCSVIQIGDVFRMVYWAEDEKGHYTIAQAESTVQQPNRWVPKGVILQRQPDKKHNSQGPCYAQVLPRKEGPWLMYFCAWGAPRPDGKMPYATNLAVSDDQGRTWRYEGDEPVFPHTEPWNCEGTGSVCVIEDNGKYRAYFSSFGEYRKPPEGADCFHAAHSDLIPSVGIGYAESEDGIHWTYPLDDWVVKPRGFHQDYYEYLLSKPWVIKDDGGYRMWCGAMGSRYRIRSLTSQDGLHWEFHDDWVFEDPKEKGRGGVGLPGTFDDVKRSYPMVLKQGDTYHFWYTGNWFGRVGEGYTTGMGYAAGHKIDP